MYWSNAVNPILTSYMKYHTETVLAQYCTNSINFDRKYVTETVLVRYCKNCINCIHNSIIKPVFAQSRQSDTNFEWEIRHRNCIGPILYKQY